MPVGLRVNPGVSYSHFDLADPARKHSRLGVTDDTELRDVAPQLSGLMFHFNCENEDFDSLATVARRLNEFEHLYNQIAEPFGWKFTRDDLNDWLDRITQPNAIRPALAA